MDGTIWHCHIAVSLDGKIARPDGSVDDWLGADYPAEDFGFDAFLAGVDAILMGRGTYEAVRRLGDWPYPGKPTVVLTTRPLDDLPPAGVEARRGDVAAVAEEIERRGPGGLRRALVVAREPPGLVAEPRERPLLHTPSTGPLARRAGPPPTAPPPRRARTRARTRPPRAARPKRSRHPARRGRSRMPKA